MNSIGSDVVSGAIKPLTVVLPITRTDFKTPFTPVSRTNIRQFFVFKFADLKWKKHRKSRRCLHANGDKLSETHNRT